MVWSLWLPIIASAAALFFASFLSWMIFQLHKKDWIKMNKEDEFISSLKDLELSPGSYMFPGCDNQDEMKSEEYQERCKNGPSGVITVFSYVGMGRNLALTFVYFLVVSFCLGYLATIALQPGAGFEPVFRFVSTAGFMTFLAATVQHSIWFHNRIIGHVIESVLYSLVVGAIFAGLWPGA